MAETVEIPKIVCDSDIKPGWISVVDTDGRPRRPIIRCQCGQYIGLANHHVFPDGSVQASFFDTNQPFQWKGQTVHNPSGCNWHVFLKLKDYNCGDFPPEDQMPDVPVKPVTAPQPTAKNPTPPEQPKTPEAYTVTPVDGALHGRDFRAVCNTCGWQTHQPTKALATDAVKDHLKKHAA